jgi:adenylate cyclase
MTPPKKISAQSPARKVLAAAFIATASFALARLCTVLPGTSLALNKLDNVLYDSLYHLRPIESQKDGPVVIIAADDTSLSDLAHGAIGKTPYGWPWPRQFWGMMIDYCNLCGAKAVAVDIIFSEPSVFNDNNGDDSSFAGLVNRSKIPVIFGTIAAPDGRPGPFAPPVKQPRLGAVNVNDDVVFRKYSPLINGFPSLASSTVSAVGGTPFTDPFLLHYYGPTADRSNTRTFRYLAASHVLGTYVNTIAKSKKPFDFGVTPDMLRGKIVVLGATTLGTYDLKSSPLSAEFPGAEIQATAIANMLEHRRVAVVHTVPHATATLLATFLAASGVAIPRRATVKVILAAIVALLLVTAAAFLFTRHQIRWLPLAMPLIAVLLATIATFAWTYMTEGRQRRFVLKALSQYVSPHVANQIDRDPGALTLGGERREMTVMFTDIQGFTDLSERMEDHKLTELLNYYLDEMSSLVFANDGTLDKYIGDAIMSFWNAPLAQPDHAVLACRAALAMERREREIQPRLEQMGAPGLLTRIGINTGPMVFGNMGSTRKFNYSVVGDSVNLGSRLEGANKFYGARILIAQRTAELVKDRFLLRKLDVLRVKGKLKPMAVYEVLAEIGEAAGPLRSRARQFESAFEHCQRRQWDQADAALQSLLAVSPDDRPAEALRKRVSFLRDHDPGPGWDGVYVAEGK